MPSRLPSVSTFKDSRVLPPTDPEKNPTIAATYWLRRDIVRGVLEPLERLKVDHLTRFYGVGHSPIREAILLLSGTGLVVHEHQKGYRVAPVSLEDYDDVVNLYGRLYKLALSMAVEHGGEAWEERVVVALHRSLKVDKVMREDDPEGRELWQQAYKKLHREIISGCGSPLLIKILGELGDRAERYVNLFADLSTDRERDSHAEHRAIVDALVARDVERLHALVERFFAGGQPMRDTIIAALRRSEPARARRRTIEPESSGATAAPVRAAVTHVAAARARRARRRSS